MNLSRMMTQSLRKRVAFDFKIFFPPVLKGKSLVAITDRDGSEKLIKRLNQDFDLILWSTEEEGLVNEVLFFENHYFSEVHYWEDNAFHWKDVRAINADFLIDDDPHHLETAMTVDIWDRYILIDPFGSPKDIEEPFRWAKIIEGALYNG